VRQDKLRASALRGEDFAGAAAAVQPQRLLVILDRDCRQHRRS
jgi:hypothetical protein